MAEVLRESLDGGHSGSVLSVSVCENSRIISGGENGEIVLWSAEKNLIKIWKVSSEDDVTCAIWSKSHPARCYVSCGSDVYTLDTSRVDCEPVQVYSCSSEDEDNEINQIALDADENHLAIAEDSGNIKVINTTDFSLYRTLRAHTNICSSVCYAPNGDLYSAAYDCDVKKWNVRKSRSVATINTKNITNDEADVENGAFSVSPSFVHSLRVSPDGRMLICGTENSLIHVFDLTQNTLQFSLTLRHHNKGVSQVVFMEYGGSSANGTGGSAKDIYLISSGNDNRVCLWDMKDIITAGRIGSTSGSSSSQRNRNKKKGGSNVKSAENSISEKILPKQEVLHTEKINAISGAELNGRPYVIVGDNSSSLTCLTLA